MRITNIECVPFRLPLRREFRWASLKVPIGGFVLFRIHTDEGVTGIGEAAPIPDWGGDFNQYSGETQESVCAITETVVRPALVGRDPTAIHACHAAMDEVVCGNFYVRIGVDLALYDNLGKCAGLPLYRLLGGLSRPSAPIAHMIGIMPNKDALDEARLAAEDGITRFQVKGGLDPDRDIELMQDLRRTLGSRFWLRLDPNQGYGRAKDAAAILKKMEAAALDYIEQPVTDRIEMAELRTMTSVPLLADESCWTTRDSLDLVTQRFADAISIYLSKAAGIAGALRIAAIADAAGFPCDVNGGLESGIGNAANLHFVLSQPAVRLPCVIPINARAGEHTHATGGAYYEDDIVTRSFPARRGELLPLEGPGLGVEVDEEKLRKFRL